MISVIIYTYNAEKNLYISINSILKQTYQDFEIICIDDASTDSSLEILEYFQQKDSRLKVLRNEINLGLDSCKNNSIDIAKGDYIYFLDGNCWLKSNAFEILIEKSKKNNLDLIIFKNRIFDDNSKMFISEGHDLEFLRDFDSKIFNQRDLDIVVQFLISKSPLSILFSTSFLKENEIQFDDNIFNLIFSNAKKISFINCYFQNFCMIDSISNPNKNILYLFHDFVDEFLPIFPQDTNEFRNLIKIEPLLLFKLIDNIEEVLINKNLFNFFKVAFFQFKIANLKNCFKNTRECYKKEFYIKMNQEFMKMHLNFNELMNIDFELYRFYILVLNYEYEKFIRFNQHSKINHDYIIKKDLEDKIENFNQIGINTSKRKNSIIVSLTSFSERLFDLHFCLYSLFNQTLKPDKIILCLNKEEFPNFENDIPENVLKFKKNGLTIKWCDNLKSFTKLIPVLEEYPNEYIVTVDDDIFYPSDLLENLWKTYEKYPHTIISSRTRIIKFNSDGELDEYKYWPLVNKFAKSTFLNFITGVGGILYFPNALSDIVFKTELFKKLCPTGDDIWFWAMAVLNKTKITGNLKPHNALKYVNISRELGIDNNRTLFHFNKNGQYDMQIKNVINYFPEIIKIIKGN